MFQIQIIMISRAIGRKYRFCQKVPKGVDDILDNYTPVNESERRKMVYDSAIMSAKDPNKHNISLTQLPTPVVARRHHQLLRPDRPLLKNAIQHLRLRNPSLKAPHNPPNPNPTQPPVPPIKHLRQILLQLP